MNNEKRLGNCFAMNGVKFALIFSILPKKRTGKRKSNKKRSVIKKQRVLEKRQPKGEERKNEEGKL